MRLARFLSVSLTVLLLTSAAHAGDDLARQVRDAENAFAATMAKRDFAAFATFIAEDAIFFGGNGALRGKSQVVAGWKPLYDGAAAQFSWKSETVEVLSSGTLAHSSGPVYDATGKRTGTFNSIWRREPDGSWKVVFDKGCEVCNCSQAAKTQP